MAEDFKLPYSGADIYRRLSEVDSKANIKPITLDEFNNLGDEVNANTLYMFTDADEEIVQADWSQEDASATDYIKNKPDILSVKDVETFAVMRGDLLDTISDYGAVAVECASATGHYLDIALHSNEITDFSGITVTLTGADVSRSVMANEDGTVVGLFSEPTFTLTLSSDAEGFDASQVLITCTYQIDLNKVLNDYVLHVSLDGEGDGTGGTGSGGTGSGGADSVFLDETLSISGAAADAKAVGDKFAQHEIIAEGMKSDIKTVSDLVGGKSVSEQINDALADFDVGAEIYTQNEEPMDAPEGALWIDMDEESIGDGSFVNEKIKSAVEEYMKENPVGGGVLNTEDDGDGNVTITTTGSISITDDGNGNVTIA